ncbi:MAG: sigma-54-dependent Fis family transcriptional regulator [Anaerolineales bacterium]
MQPGTSLPDFNQLYHVWEKFTTTSTLDLGVDPLVAISWQRCAPRLNPERPPRWTYVSNEVLPLTLRQHRPLMRFARPIMEDIHQFIEGSDAMLILADSTSCVLDLLGDVETVAYATGLGIRQGAFFDESHLGTNAFAVALVEGCPARIVGPEHFLRSFHGVTSAAAPIFDLDGFPLGVIGLFSRLPTYDPCCLGIAMAAARAIENQLQADLLIREASTNASSLNATMNAISEGVVAWTANGLLTHLNAQAGAMLGLKTTAVVGRPLQECITLHEALIRATERGEEPTDAEVSLGVPGGTPCHCLVSLRVIRGPEGEAVAYIATMRQIEQVHQLVNRLVGAQARLTLDDMVGNGPAARRVRRQALTAADAKACVLLVGEGGTGKSLLARAIHNSGRRARGPFLGINCRAMPRELVMGEFLGFEAGAFNSSSAGGQPSKFELAHGGTLYLEEVEALPLDMQAALLRVIEVGDVIRLGGTRAIPVDVRVIASSSADLDACVAEGSFRADLLFRLSSFVIMPPPLRERPEDIPLLLDRLLEKLSAQVGHVLAVTPQAKSILCAYPWPGNIRELESVMERAALLCDGEPIRPDHLPTMLRQRRAITPGRPATEPVRSLLEAEKWAILCAGRAARGNLSQTAQFLGIGRTTLWRKMKELDLSSDDFYLTRTLAEDDVSN